MLCVNYTTHLEIMQMRFRSGTGCVNILVAGCQNQDFQDSRIFKIIEASGLTHGNFCVLMETNSSECRSHLGEYAANLGFSRITQLTRILRKLAIKSMPHARTVFGRDRGSKPFLQQRAQLLYVLFRFGCYLASK